MTRRVAILLPELHLDEADRAVEAEAGVLLWSALCETLAPHAGVGLFAPWSMEMTRSGGRWVARRAQRDESTMRELLDGERRDELLWLEVRGGVVRLHSHAVDGQRRSFDALGHELGAQIAAVLTAWLAERQLAPLARPFAAISLEDLLIAARALAAIDFKADVPVVADEDDSDEEEQTPEEDSEEQSDEETDDEGADNDEGEEPSAPPGPTREERLAAGIAKLAVPLKTAAISLLAMGLGADDAPHLRALDANHPFAGNEDPREALAAWPSSPQALIALAELPAGDGAPSALERVAAAGQALMHAPGDYRIAVSASSVLSKANLDDEALRAMARATDPYNSPAHQALLDRYLGTERLGAWLEQSHRSASVHGCPMDSPWPWTSDQIRIDLACATSLMQCGRLDEAIALRANRLEGREAAWPYHTRILHKWRKDPRFVAWCYAREGYFRGEDGRVIEGFGRIEPDDGIDAGMFLDGLLGVGRDWEVSLAWAHFVKGRRFASPFSRLAAGRALFAVGHWRDGLEELFFVELRHPSGGHHTQVAHALRLVGAASLDELMAAVDERLEAGARTLASRLARNIADFLPDAADELADALHEAEREFDAAWLDAFPATTRGRAATDALFAELAAAPPTQANADALVNRWREAVVALPADDKPGMAEAHAYVATQALARYLTAPSSLMTGALRTVAAEAIDGAARVAADLSTPMVEAVFAVLEPAAAAAEQTLALDWLAHFERRLAVDERREDGPAPRLPERVLTPERLAVETNASTHAFATGGVGAVEWADAIAQQAGEMSEEDVLDALGSAAFLSIGDDIGPTLHATHALFAAGQGEAAFRTVCAGLAGVKDAFRDKRIESLAAPWKAAQLDVPFSFKAAATEIFNSLQKGNPARAERISQWVLALDSNNAEAHRNAGLAYTQQAKVEAGMEHLMRATRDQATQLLSGVLYHCKHIPQAMAVLDYASRWYTRADQWLTYGGVAYGAMDNPRTVKSYGLAYTLDPDAFDASMLNAYAGVLDEVGDFAMCERVARHLLRVAGEDLTWLTNGWNHLACAFIGQGKLAEAVELAEKAVAQNPLPDNNEPFAKTLGRAKSGEKPVVPPLVPTEPQRPAIYTLVDDSDLQNASAQLGDADWRVKRAALRAARYRFGSESRVAVTPRARAAAEQILVESAGSDDVQAALCRSFALEIRAQSDFARDPMPWLGDRMTRENFYTEFRARGGIVLGEAPVQRAVFVDREVVPGSKIATASAYVSLLRDLASMKPDAALAKHGLDAAAYIEVAKAWAAALDNDAAVVATVEAGLSS
jgi:tetratricopeptide (TPR) repeat protein